MLISKPMVPGGGALISIGYKYNAQKVLSVIVTVNTGITNTGLTHLSTYPDQSYNGAIRPVDCFFPLSFISSLGLLMRLTPTTNQDSMIWPWISYGLLSVIVYGYVLQLLWE